MLTKLTIRKFKSLEEVEIELSNPVVFIGPNNSGKTSAMQALTLWDIGVKRWNEKYSGKSAPKKRSGVTINRKDLLTIPHPKAIQLWHKLHVRDLKQTDIGKGTENVRIEIIVEGVTQDRKWECGLEFDYANEESIYCRPLRLGTGKTPDRMPIPEEVEGANIALLPSMSGLAATETRLDQGAVNVRVGEGRTAEVLRNLCFRIFEGNPDKWQLLTEQIRKLFGAQLGEPRYVQERGEITMGYQERGVDLDLSSSGRGLQQTLLILAYMYANPNSVILLDEPDAHLEILRQRQIYDLINEAASNSGNQIIAASHSEILLNEAADKDLVIAFVGKKPHRIGSQTNQVQKALAQIGFDQYYQAEQTNWILYLEGSTDLAILRGFANRLNHKKAIQALGQPFVRYVGNKLNWAKSHYYGLREAIPYLEGVALFDRLDYEIADDRSLKILVWKKREIENYLCTQTTLEAYTKGSELESQHLPLFAENLAENRLTAMRAAISEVSGAMTTLKKGSPWDDDVKVSDEFLKPLFEKYFQNLELPNLMNKKNFYELAKYVPTSGIDPEIGQKLDEIADIAERAARKIA